jgi:hypothetical protein
MGDFLNNTKSLQNSVSSDSESFFSKTKCEEIAEEVAIKEVETGSGDYRWYLDDAQTSMNAEETAKFFNSKKSNRWGTNNYKLCSGDKGAPFEAIQIEYRLASNNPNYVDKFSDVIVCYSEYKRIYPSEYCR